MDHIKYTKYKDSNIYWVGEIPSHWESIPVKHHFFSKKQVAGTLVDDYQRLALTLNGVIKRSKEDAEGLQPEKFETYQIVRKNSLIFKLIDLENIKTSRVGLSKYDGLVSPAYIILSTNGDILPTYAENYFLNMWHEHIFNQLGSVGVRSNLNKEDVLNLPIIKPPLEEQQQIANYLDKQTVKINETIVKNKQLIELLEEKRVTLINQIVTKGLNPDAPMKDSGVEWIGEIPKHWDVSRLKFLISKNAQYGANCEPESDETKFDYRYVRITDIDDDASLKNNIVYLSKDNAKGFILNEGDVLFARSGATVGKTYLYKKSDGNCCFAGYLIRYVTNNHLLNPKYLLYFSFSKSYTEWIKIVSTQATIQNVSADKYDNLIISLPDIDEQNAIVSYLDNEISHINSIISKIKENITLLEEYKTSLIHHVVTGKIDVRGEEI